MLCSSCGSEIAKIDELLPVETDTQKYYYCITCIKKAVDTLNMKMYLKKDDLYLQKKMRNFLKRKGLYEKN